MQLRQNPVFLMASATRHVTAWPNLLLNARDNIVAKLCILLAWVANLSPWICGHRNQNHHTQSGQSKPTVEELQASLYTLGAGDTKNLLAVGIFTHVYDIGNGRVRKLPAPDPDDLELAIESIRREGLIYEHLGNDSKIIKCLARGDLYVDLEYAPCGHLEEYLNKHCNTSNAQRLRFAREVVESVVFIHNKGIIHSDLAARQFLLDASLHCHLSDFGFSSIGNSDVLGFEITSHHMPRDIDGSQSSTTQSDLFALGSTLYEIMTGSRPYKDELDDAITRLYSSGCFPDVAGIQLGQIMLHCWQGRFRSAKEILDNIDSELSVTQN